MLKNYCLFYLSTIFTLCQCLTAILEADRDIKSTPRVLPLMQDIPDPDEKYIADSCAKILTRQDK